MIGTSFMSCVHELSERTPLLTAAIAWRYSLQTLTPERIIESVHAGRFVVWIAQDSLFCLADFNSG